jgi:hypothetical protein
MSYFDPKINPSLQSFESLFGAPEREMTDDEKTAVIRYYRETDTVKYKLALALKHVITSTQHKEASSTKNALWELIPGCDRIIATYERHLKSVNESYTDELPL